MKTKLGLMAALACVGLQAQTDIGVYPSTTWASTNLLVNRAIEVGTVGQAIGYSANGVVGPITISGGGGSDTNAVASVPDLATLTNSVVKYTKAIVGLVSPEALYQLVPPGTFVTSDVWKDPSTAPAYLNQVMIRYPDGMVICTNSEGLYLGAEAGVYTEPRVRLTLQFDAKKYGPDDLLLYWASSQWSNLFWHTPTNLTTTWNTFKVSFEPKDDNDTNAILVKAELKNGVGNNVGNALHFRNVRYSVGAELSFPSYVYPSVPIPGYGWQQVGLESPGGGGLVVKTNIINTGTVWETPLSSDCDVLFLDFGSVTGVVDVISIVPGTSNGQRLQILGIYLLAPQLAQARFTDSTNILCTGGTSYASWNQAIDFTWNHGVWLETSQNLDAGNLAATLLPAPWPPPDSNGVQLLPENVKRQLIVELLPYMASNWTEIVTHLGTNAVVTP